MPACCAVIAAQSARSGDRRLYIPSSIPRQAEGPAHRECRLIFEPTVEGASGLPSGHSWRDSWIFGVSYSKECRHECRHGRPEVHSTVQAKGSFYYARITVLVRHV